MRSNYKNHFYGIDTQMRTACSQTKRVFLNSAATPQVLRPAIRKLMRTLPVYAYDNEPNVISEQLKEAYQAVRGTVLDYIGGDPQLDTVIYTPNTTVAINLLSEIFQQGDPNQVILTSRMEHMANYLPYQQKFTTVLINLTPEGNIDLEDYRLKLEQYQGQVKLVAVTGASNITGMITPYYQMAEMAHQYGAMIFVDAVQLVQHKLFSMKAHTDPQHIDFLSFDGHKCYTGQSGGVLVGSKGFLDQYLPLIYGAGMTDFVSEERIVYRPAPERYEAGYPDFLGILSLGAVLTYFKTAGFPQMITYETNLYYYLISQLNEIPGLIIYGSMMNCDHVPIISFNLNGLNFDALGYLLGYEYGIAVAIGTCGANIYVQDLLGLSSEQAYELFLNGQKFGVVRVSLGIFNTREDIKSLIFALRRISAQYAYCQ